MELEWLIKNETENTTLDFKREQYLKPKYSDLIKDVISMANTPIGKRSILLLVLKKLQVVVKSVFQLMKKNLLIKLRINKLSERI